MSDHTRNTFDMLPIGEDLAGLTGSAIRAVPNKNLARIAVEVEVPLPALVPARDAVERVALAALESSEAVARMAALVAERDEAARRAELAKADADGELAARRKLELQSPPPPRLGDLLLKADDKVKAMQAAEASARAEAARVESLLAEARAACTPDLNRAYAAARSAQLTEARRLHDEAGRALGPALAACPELLAYAAALWNRRPSTPDALGDLAATRLLEGAFAALKAGGPKKAPAAAEPTAEPAEKK